jgi:hypothetical protein
MKSLIEVLNEGILDMDDELDNSDSAVIQGLLDRDKNIFLQSANIFWEDVKMSSKKIKEKDIKDGSAFQANKIYVVFWKKNPEQITLIYRPKSNDNKLCAMNPSQKRSRFHSGIIWAVFKSNLKLMSGFIPADSGELYELPEKYYPLWDAVHTKINPDDNAFDVK